ncbi:MAG: radical SAM protein [Candidatus Portnoybacteria bacterium]|nr:radical SAM protein [Candidatus Portnoybacteria bacterium]MDD4982504.1 radical SAM protein [Candidatus Portnoybacteria bacterium]
MNKILLINPPFNIAKAVYDTSLSVGLLSMASYLKSKGVPMEILDGARQPNFLERLKTEVPKSGAAAFSVMTMQVGQALEISKIIRELNPECKIIWGGPHPTFFPEQTIKSGLIDIVAVGEGEETILEIASGKKISEVAGAVYKERGRIFSNKARALHDPAQMPLFDWELVPREILERLTLIPSLTSRGCPHRCSFCINAILKNSWRPRTAQQVLEDLRIIKSKPYFAGKPLRFWDENFFVDMARARAIIDGMIKNDLVIPWETTVRANYIREGMIDDDFMAKLKKSGCYLLSFGAESGCPRLLKKMKKDINPEDVIISAKAALRHGIIPQYSFMIGLPGEARSEMMETLNLIDKLIKLSPKIQILGPQAFRPYPGSELYDECVASGWKEPQSLEEWAELSRNEINYLSVENFPWVKKEDKDFVESTEAFVRFGAHGIKSALGSSVKAQKLLKLGFILICQLRWKLKFFAWPVEYKLAKKFVSQ